MLLTQVASGVPVIRKDHAEEICRLNILLIEWKDVLESAELLLRIGVNSGKTAQSM